MDEAEIDRALVLRVAKLASLSLSDSEVDGFVYALRRIVACVEQLAALDTDDVPPTAQVRVDRAPWRADEARPSLPHEEALSQAPAIEGGGFSVPPFVQ